MQSMYLHEDAQRIDDKFVLLLSNIGIKKFW